MSQLSTKRKLGAVHRVIGRYMAWLSGMGLFVVVGACDGRSRTSRVVPEVGQGGGGQPEGSNQPADKKVTAGNLRTRPLGGIYRQAGDAARQRLDVDSARTRLDELDMQIEREKETTQ